MRCVIYMSEAMVAPHSVAARTILDSSMRNNPRLGLTGFLHREEDRYLQCLEGPEGAVEQMLTRIRSDRRHRGVRILHDGPLARRRFAEWAMGYGDERVGTFRAFLEQVSLKDNPGDATAAEAAAFLAGAAQRVDLGLGACRA